METEKKNWIKRLQARWQLKNTTQVMKVLLVFALTGTTVLVIKPFVLTLLGIDRKLQGWEYFVYLLGILPVYQLILLFYGFLLGEFWFFWSFEKKMVIRITRLFKKNRLEDQKN